MNFWKYKTSFASIRRASDDPENRLISSGWRHWSVIIFWVNATTVNHAEKNISRRKCFKMRKTASMLLYFAERVIRQLQNPILFGQWEPRRVPGVNIHRLFESNILKLIWLNNMLLSCLCIILPALCHEVCFISDTLLVCSWSPITQPQWTMRLHGKPWCMLRLSAAIPWVHPLYGNRFRSVALRYMAATMFLKL